MNMSDKYMYMMLHRIYYSEVTVSSCFFCLLGDFLSSADLGDLGDPSLSLAFSFLFALERSPSFSLRGLASALFSFALERSPSFSLRGLASALFSFALERSPSFSLFSFALVCSPSFSFLRLLLSLDCSSSWVISLSVGSLFDFFRLFLDLCTPSDSLWSLVLSFVASWTSLLSLLCCFDVVFSTWSICRLCFRTISHISSALSHRSSSLCSVGGGGAGGVSKSSGGELYRRYT